MITTIECKHEIKHQLYNKDSKKVNRCVACGMEQEITNVKGR